MRQIVKRKRKQKRVSLLISTQITHSILFALHLPLCYLQQLTARKLHSLSPLCVQLNVLCFRINTAPRPYLDLRRWSTRHDSLHPSASLLDLGNLEKTAP
jgi:hypothetical protein